MSPSKRISAMFRSYLCLQTVLFLVWYDVFPCAVEGSTFEMHSKLITKILGGNRSSKRVRPVKNSSDPVNVTIDMTLSNVIDMDEKYQILTTNVWLRQNWTNELMSWDPDEYDGIKYVSIEASDIWQPDTILYNNVFEEFDGRLDNVKTLVRVGYTGSTNWNAPFIFKTLCKIRVKNFPFDSQQCKLKFGSWQYSSKELNLSFVSSKGNLDENRIKNGEWDVVKVVVERNELVYPCCPDDTYPDVTFVINIKRRSLFYMFNLIIPNFLIALLAFFSFYIPVECGERISFVMTVLLSMFVFLLLVAESIPPTSDAVPAIGVYFTSSIVLVSLALVATGFVLKINYMYLQRPGNSVPRTLKWILFTKLGPFLRFEGCPYFVNKRNSSPNLSCMKNLLRKADKTVPSDEPAVFCRNGQGTASFKERTRSVEAEYPGKEEGSITFVLGETSSSDIEVCRKRESMASDLHLIASSVAVHDEENMKSAESRLAAAIVDRFFMLLFVIVFIISTMVILIIPYVSSE